MRINVNIINHLNIDAECIRSIDIAEFVQSVIDITCDDIDTLINTIWEHIENEQVDSWVYKYHTDAGQVKTCVISTEE